MRTTTNTSFLVSAKGSSGWYSQDGYSKYTERWKLNQEGKLPPGEQVYGFAQCLDHIKELREHVYYGDLVNKDKHFVIQSSTVVTTEIDAPCNPVQRPTENLNPAS